MSLKDKSLTPLLGMLKPVAKKYITRENIDAVYDQVTQEADLAEGEKAVVIINRTQNGTVVAGVYAIDGDRRITRQFSLMSVEDLILSFLN